MLQSFVNSFQHLIIYAALKREREGWKRDMDWFTMREREREKEKPIEWEQQDRQNIVTALRPLDGVSESLSFIAIPI